MTVACVLPSFAARAQSAAYVPGQADLLLQGRPAEGLLVLQSGYRNDSLVDVDGLVYVMAGDGQVSGDVLSVSVLLREPHGLGQLRLGRFLLGTGAVRPVQIDGADLLVRAIGGSSLELFGGMPVVPDFGPRAFDWLSGGRLAERLLDDKVALGVSYLQRREAGEIDAEEVGADASLHPLRWLSMQALGSWSLIAHGLAEARISALAAFTSSQLELFGSRRVAARLLPATSLFSVIGSAPSTSAGSDLSIQAFPRLRVGGTVALDGLDDRFGYRVLVRSTLALADSGPAQISVEALRRRIGSDGLTGGAVRMQLPLTAAISSNASAEFVAADHPGPNGALWPWLLVGASWTPRVSWLVAAALGFKATPEVQRDVYAMLRVGYSGQLSP